MVVTRRGFLYGSGAIAAAAAFGPSFQQAAVAAPALTGPDLEALRSRWVNTLTGRHLIPQSAGSFVSVIEDLDERVAEQLDRVSPTPTRFFDDRDWAVGASETAKSNNMRMNYVGLRLLALAWATPGSTYEKSSELLDVVTQGLAHMHSTVYNPSTTWWGNWWSWNIGATQPLSDTMAILHAELEQSAIDDYCTAIDHFIPDGDPRMQAHPTGPKESEGANRVDICQAMVVRSIVQPDTQVLQRSVAALSPTWQYVTEGNGFFRDGSFVQHSTIGYTGTYGLVLLGGLSRLFALLAGTAFDITDDTRKNVTGLIEKSFAPLMYNGQMMDAVRGRAISRIQERSIDNGNILIEHTLRLAEAADAETARRWRGLCKHWILSNNAETITSSTDITRLALVTHLLGSDVPPVDVPTGPHMFPAMDRLVHRGSDNSWAMCVAMCSNRIAWSEGTPQENFEASKTSQGMTYIYLFDDDDHFDDEYWATSDLTAPVGTTVDMTPLPRNPEGTWGEQTPDNEWTGGAQLDDMAVAGMHVVAPGGTGLTARKTWFSLPGMVVALGADISTKSDAEVRTVVEHRNLGVAPRKLVVDGITPATDSVLTNPRWAHVEGVGGYVFLDAASKMLAGVAEREGTWLRNNVNERPGADVLQRRHYATVAYHHGVGENVKDAHYAYILLPHLTQSETVEAAEAPPVSIIKNDAATQAVVLGDGVVGATFWKPGTAGDFTSDSSACLLARREEQRINLAVSDPTQNQLSIGLTVADFETRSVEGLDASRVTFEQRGDDTAVTIDTSGTAGRTVRFSLAGRPGETIPSSPPSSSPSATTSPIPSATTTPSSWPSATATATTTVPAPGLPNTGV